MSATLLSVRGLVKHFPARSRLFGTPSYVHAVDGVSFDVGSGETLGIVGESGCGKSTTGYTIARLYDPTAGQIFFEGTDIAHLDEGRLHPVRRQLQMIFQDPYSSLNPRMTVGETVGEPFEIHEVCPKAEARERVAAILDLVGLNREQAGRYPHEFSGGQRQRIGIARALALNPKLVICDEPISALDVSIQAQIVNLLQELQERLGLAYIFIAHNLSMVKYISDRIAVMYLGKIVELARSTELHDRPIHPYTQALLSAVPVADPDLQAARHRIILEGGVPSPIDPKPGCRFASRCRQAMDRCKTEEPELLDRGGGHLAACHLE
jgi:oligopeptide transport system ATP-binding protein